ncbi:MAG: 30S ribosomal protein S16 [Alphaproteobacteria bacterium]|nr:30S ribosomal protein S16 [Alphaproteobacteria bacterium]
MAVKLRLQRHGAKKRPFYILVAADSRAPRDGKFIEKLGTYNPLTSPATIELNRQACVEWLDKGAIPSETVNRIFVFKGVRFLRHLHRGVKLNLFDKQTAEAKFENWLKEHQSKVETRHAKHKHKKEHAVVS